MNREILFRGKRVDNEMWIYGDLLQSTDIVNCTEISENTGMGVRYDIIPETVGQYTGLKDDNGTKIFEGDILKVKSVDIDYEYITKVYCSCNTLCVDVVGEDYDSTAIGFADDIWDTDCAKVEVIGNIYDNPELLKERDTNG